MVPHVERMVNEQEELVEKIEKLQTFISDNPIFGTLTKEEQYDMHLQLLAMSIYSAVLQRRIERVQANELPKKIWTEYDQDMLEAIDCLTKQGRHLEKEHLNWIKLLKDRIKE